MLLIQDPQSPTDTLPYDVLPGESSIKSQTPGYQGARVLQGVFRVEQTASTETALNETNSKRKEIKILNNSKNKVQGVLTHIADQGMENIALDVGRGFGSQAGPAKQGDHVSIDVGHVMSGIMKKDKLLG